MQRSNYVTNSSLNFSVFTESQKDEIHSASLEVLADVGVDMNCEKALSLVKKAGAFVDGNRVKFPPGMVEKAIRSAPSRIVLSNRDGERTMFLEGNNFYYGSGPTVTFTLDPFTGEHREATIADTARAARVMDALPNIDYLMDFGTPSDVTPEIMDVIAFKTMMENSKKPIVHWAYNVNNVKAMIDMAAAQRGSLQALQESPFFAIYREPITPLVHDFTALDVCMTMAEYNLPCVYTPAPQAGVTAPATLAGTIVVGNCECLSGLVVSQLVREGAPFIMGGVFTLMDLNSTQITYGSPEFCLLMAGMSEMASYYKIPMFSTAGCTDSKAIDQQFASETSLNILMSALSGGNLIHDVGYIESGMCTSLLSLVICDEIISKVKYMMKGIEVSDRTLALDVIREVGPGGNFITEEHTVENFKKDWWFPALHNRQRFNVWEAEGKQTMGDVALKKLQHIVDTHKVPALDSKVQSQLDEILNRVKV